MPTTTKRGPGRPRKHPLPEASKPDSTEIDFLAAIDDPTTSKPAPAKNPNPPIHNINNISNNVEGVISNNNISRFDAKGPLTEPECKFLEFLIEEDMDIESAMKSAGYGHMHPKYMPRLAKKIIRKYEQGGPEVRKVFQDVGFGELSVAAGIKDLAQNAKSEAVRLNAHALAAKCLQMTQEQSQGSQGVTVLIQAADKVQVNQGVSPQPSSSNQGGVSGQDRPSLSARPMVEVK